MIIRVKTAEWAKCLWEPVRYLVLHGGRGGGKTTETAQMYAVDGARRKRNVICARQFQNSIKDSVKPEIEAAIERCGLSKHYRILEDEIIGANGTVFRFKGLDRNIFSIKGWADVDDVWVEEANTLKGAALELLLPTIRKPGSRIVFTLNRHKRSDPVDKMFIGGTPPPNSIVRAVQWSDNPFFTDELEAERQRCLANDPERYAHIWGGEPDDVDGKSVINYLWVQAAIDAHLKLGFEPTGKKTAALDVADEGEDTSALAVKHGVVVTSISEWSGKGSDTFATAQRAVNECDGLGVPEFRYDADGIGAFVKGDVRIINEARAKEGKPPLVANPWRGSGAVLNPEKSDVEGRKNKDYFRNAKAQAWWSLRVRFRNTYRAVVEGAKFAPEDLISISSQGCDVHKVASELSQATYDEDMAGKIIVDKSPNGSMSPNLADSVMMLFAPVKTGFFRM